MNQEVIDAAPVLGVVARAGVGLDNVDVPAATRAGVKVVNALESNVVSVAELAASSLRHIACGERVRAPWRMAAQRLPERGTVRQDGRCPLLRPNRQARCGPSVLSALFVVFGVACLAGVSITGVLLDHFPQAMLTTAVVTQAVGMLGLYTVGSDPVAAVVFLVMRGGALGPVFMTTQNAMLHCAPGCPDLALAANSGLYNAGIAAGAALGGLILPMADVRGTLLAGGLLTTAACVVLLGGRLLRSGLESVEEIHRQLVARSFSVR